MIRRWNTPPFRIAGIYLAVSLVYIVASDWLVQGGAWSNWLPGMQTTKGMAFVLLSAILIHFLIARELRRREAMELQLMRAQRMEAVGQLTSGVAHDFNNFLTVILGNLELIQQDAEAGGDLRKRADQALHATERGADLTRRLLAFSRRQRQEPRLVDVNECVAQMKMLLGSVIGEGVAVEADLAPDLPPIMADPGQLETAVLNLALNARDAMPSGGTITLATFTVQVGPDRASGRWPAKPGGYVVIAVDDDGEGMTQQVQDRLSEPFFTTKPLGEGTGLGFPMAHGFVKKSGGHVVVDSDVGRGTSVKLHFPAATQAQRRCADPSRPTPDQGGDETVLLVENDIAVRDVLTDLLTRLGYRVLLASRASEAHELLAGDKPVDLLMTDMVLAGRRNGITLVDEVRRTRPSMPVLIISGFADVTLAGGPADDPHTGWLAKPCSRQIVARRLRDLLDAGRAETAPR